MPQNNATLTDVDTPNAVLFEGEDLVNQYKPGQSVYFSLTVENQPGVLVDPAAIALTLHSPSGSNITVPVTRDSTGTYHATQTIPMLQSSAGLWVRRWQTTSPDGLAEVFFQVPALAF